MINALADEKNFFTSEYAADIMNNLIDLMPKEVKSETPKNKAETKLTDLKDKVVDAKDKVKDKVIDAKDKVKDKAV